MRWSTARRARAEVYKLKEGAWFEARDQRVARTPRQLRREKSLKQKNFSRWLDGVVAEVWRMAKTTSRRRRPHQRRHQIRRVCHRRPTITLQIWSQSTRRMIAANPPLNRRIPFFRPWYLGAVGKTTPTTLLLGIAVGQTLRIESDRPPYCLMNCRPCRVNVRRIAVEDGTTMTTGTAGGKKMTGHVTAEKTITIAAAALTLSRAATMVGGETIATTAPCTGPPMRTGTGHLNSVATRDATMIEEDHPRAVVATRAVTDATTQVLGHRRLEEEVAAPAAGASIPAVGEARTRTTVGSTMTVATRRLSDPPPERRTGSIVMVAAFRTMTRTITSPTAARPTTSTLCHHATCVD